ncbi:MAG: hypothetical protein Q9215_004724 [Flavoplaca cf. flavocitrina]
MPPYPTVHQIEEIFQTGEGGPEGFIDHIDPKVQVYIVGHDHHLAGEISGKDTLKDDHFAHFADLMDFDKPNKLEILRVIGGGDSPWACVEVICTGKSKAGKIPPAFALFSAFPRSDLRNLANKGRRIDSVFRL